MKLSKPIHKYFRCFPRQTAVSETLGAVLMACMLVCMLVCMLNCVAMEADAARLRTTLIPARLPCEYSVRDVAFVNVHGKSWHLQLIKPTALAPQDFQDWNKILKAKLENSNVGFVWYDADSNEAKGLLEQNSQAISQPKSGPRMFLTGPSDHTFNVSDRGASLSFSQQIDQLVHSPIRQKMLQHLVDSLCVVLLVESGGSPDQSANDTVDAAVAQIDKQMWTLEKPTDNGPVMVRVSAAEIENEKWLLNSLEINLEQLPAVAIVYGQGRRLGEVLTGPEISIETIVGRASVCGSDCECDLNRDWLYGQQMMHVWDRELERKAEGSLTFDPNSAFVIAEVSQIIQKNSTRLPTDSRINLGGGLVIHDLDQIPPTAGSIAVEPQTAESPTAEARPPVANPGSPSIEQASQVSTSRGDPDSLNTLYSETENRGTDIPWTIILGLFVSLIVVSMLLIQKSKRRQ